MIDNHVHTYTLAYTAISAHWSHKPSCNCKTIANTAKNIQFSCTCNTICIEIVNITKYHDTSRSNSDHTTLLQLIIHLLTCGIQHSNSDHTTLLHLQHHWLYTHLHHDIPHSYSITYSSAIAKEIIISHYTHSRSYKEIVDMWFIQVA